MQTVPLRDDLHSSVKTAYKDRRVLTSFQKVVGDRRLNEITAFQVEKWKTFRVKSVKRSTVNRELNIIRGCFARAVEWRELVSSPLASVKAFTVDDGRLRILTDEEIATVKAAGPVWHRLLMRVTLESLLRLSEALNLHRSDVGPSWLSVRRKGGKVKQIPATPDLCVALKAACHPKSGNVFGEGKDGKIPTQQTATNRIKRLLAKLDIPDASHHTLRHTGASAMLAAGHSMRAVQEIGGWSSLRMLERYTHPTGDEMQRAVQTLGQQTAVTLAVTAVRSPTVKIKTRERRKA